MNFITHRRRRRSIERKKPSILLFIQHAHSIIQDHFFSSGTSPREGGPTHNIITNSIVIGGYQERRKSVVSKIENLKNNVNRAQGE